jgi:hypothetical protein
VQVKSRDLFGCHHPCCCGIQPLNHTIAGVHRRRALLAFRNWSAFAGRDERPPCTATCGPKGVNEEK